MSECMCCDVSECCMELPEALDVVEAAIAYVHGLQMAHHVKYQPSKELKRLIAVVTEYEENRL